MEGLLAEKKKMPMKTDTKDLDGDGKTTDKIPAFVTKKQKTSKGGPVPKQLEPHVKAKQGKKEDKEEKDLQEKSYGITTSPKNDQSLTGRPLQGKDAKKPKEKATGVDFGAIKTHKMDDKKPGKPKRVGKGDGKGNFSTVQDVNEEEVDLNDVDVVNLEEGKCPHCDGDAPRSKCNCKAQNELADIKSSQSSINRLNENRLLNINKELMRRLLK